MGQQTLSLSQQQRMQMILAPQLRQSLEMLQLPILELRTVIQQELEQNPTLEESPGDNEQIEIESGSSELEDNKELDFDKDFEAMAQLDDEWRDYFFQDQNNYGSTSESAEKHQFLLDSLPQQESLQEHLMGQLTFAGLSEDDEKIAEMIIGSIDEDGYLTLSIEDLSETAGFDVEHLRDILSIVQEFHPTGVGAKDLRECLLLQLERLGQVDSLARKIVEGHLKDIGARKFSTASKALKVSVEDIQEAARFIASLDPKPGRICTAEVSSYVFPEVVVQKIEGEYLIMMDDDQLPHLRISNHYRQLMREATTTRDVKNYIQERVRAGAFLIKSIHQRQKTIYKIAAEIVRVQKAFLDQGIAHLKPVTMSQVADAVGVHETTVSRAVNGKYMRTPQGMYEMKYFFTTGLKAADGRDVSNRTVKDMILTLVAAEDPANPHSDQELLEDLKEQGINIARRTIAKYRLVLRIPPSHLRKAF
ncbi:MAG: RNA polymerase factor sigma-54 [Verrucomicrobia bacterium]|nr:RNA polymerase factor sigma-54 [Verrucomicrobiota bacterium]MDA1085761.1 RNA polymerase factor sigma-54 [Verrucomicrobiota bacterium]